MRELKCSANHALEQTLISPDEPVILRGLVQHWPAVSSEANAFASYVAKFYQGQKIWAARGAQNSAGRIAYDDAMKALNCKAYEMAFDVLLNELMAGPESLLYMGTTPVENILPGFLHENTLPISEFQPTVNMWMGNQSCVPAHFDLPDNIACNVLGRRRFTLFPPDQLDNLYVGPLDFTPAGQAISLVDIRNPDYDSFPRYKVAEQHARVVELEAGDALFIPSMWWHNVEGLDPVNVLINYWWRQTPAYMTSPADAFDLALLTMRNLPEAPKKAWKGLMDQYVFENNEAKIEHIPEHARGVLGELSDTIARRIRAKILSRLNR